MKYKITNRTTKDEAARLIGANLSNVPDGEKSLNDQIAYTMSHLGDATRKDLISLLKDVMKVAGEAFIVPAAADGNDTKSAVPQTESKDESKPDTKETESKSENLVKKSKKGAPKIESNSEDTSKTEEPKDESKDKSKSKKGAPKPRKATLADVFPDTIKLGDQTFTVDHSVKTIKDLANPKVEYEFAFYWTERHLHQFPYMWHKSPENPKSFENDLDTAQLFYVSDKGVVAYCVSDYTEGLYTVYQRDLEEFEGMRYCNGIEFQIYSRPVEEETEEPEEETAEEESEETAEA